MQDTLEGEDLAPAGDPRRSPSDTPSGSRWPLVVLGAVVLFNLVVLRAEPQPVLNLNDSTIHGSMLAWANTRIEDGHLPLDGWYPDVSLGSSRFHHYQSLPHVLGGALAVLTGPERALTWTLYLGLALWPIVVYAGGRLMGWNPWVCAFAGALSPLIVSEPQLGYEWGSYAWRGYGTWAQLWGMWLLPLAWGTSWRAVSQGRSYAIAALVLALTIAAHLLTGYLALLSLGVFALVKWSDLLRRVGRAAVVGLGGILVASWVVVPLVVDRVWTVNDEFSRGKIYYDSFGARRILGWLFTGQVFDRNRAPVVTILVFAGLAVALWRFGRHERARALVGLSLLSLVLFFGRPTLGDVLHLLPGSGDLFLRRFVFGVHLAGLYLAGIGAVRLGQLGLGLISRVGWLKARPALVWAVGVAAAIVFVSSAFVERGSWAARGGQWIHEQAAVDATEGADFGALVDIGLERGPGRFFAGMRSSAMKDTIGQVPLYAALVNQHVESVGFTRPTWSLSSPIEYRFSSFNPAHYELFAIRYVIDEVADGPPVQAERIAERGRFALWELDTGYVEVVDVLPPIVADRTNLGLQTAEWFRSDLPARHANPGIAFEGHDAPPATVDPDELPDTPPGVVTSETVELGDGRARATVSAERPSLVMLKTSFDPRWRVTVDGRVVEPQMIAPSFVGASVPAGDHVVTFEYEPFPRYDVLLLIGGLTLVGLWAVPRILRARTVPPSGGDETTGA
ncbi:MAG TPA: DUF6541 family protein [Actinomycetota bacterium]